MECREALKEFSRNIKSYGGIQKLFKALNETSPEYAQEIEQIYIQAIEGIIQ